MGNYCYFPAELRNYQKTSISQDDNDKHFLWGSAVKEKPYFFFVDFQCQKLHELKLPKGMILYNFSGCL